MTVPQEPSKLLLPHLHDLTAHDLVVRVLALMTSQTNNAAFLHSLSLKFTVNPGLGESETGHLHSICARGEVSGLVNPFTGQTLASVGHYEITVVPRTRRDELETSLRWLLCSDYHTETIEQAFLNRQFEVYEFSPALQQRQFLLALAKVEGTARWSAHHSTDHGQKAELPCFQSALAGSLTRAAKSKESASRSSHSPALAPPPLSGPLAPPLSRRRFRNLD